MEADQIKEIFDSIDEDGNGELSLEEFGQAILKTLQPADEEEGDDN